MSAPTKTAKLFPKSEYIKDKQVMEIAATRIGIEPSGLKILHDQLDGPAFDQIVIKMCSLWASANSHDFDRAMFDGLKYAVVAIITAAVMS